MTTEMLDREDLTIYVVAGVPKSFRKALRKLVEEQAKGVGDVMLLDQEFTDWVIAHLKGEKRRARDKTPASAALWRAFSALSAARYHLQHQPVEEERVRELRSRVEELWREVSPMFEEEGEA